MSALRFKLLLYLCVWSLTLQANGIQNLRYPTRFDNNQLRFGKRQDFLTKSRLFMWKPALNSGQMYPNVKTPAMPLSFNRYGIPPPPPMAPIHPNYMFAMPTKVNYPSYQPMKEIDDKRKPGNLHHITIINAIMPKPYLPTVPTHNSHPTTTFRNYRTNSKLLYHQYFNNNNNNNFGRQNMENFNKQLQLQQQQLQQQQLQQQQLQQQQLQQQQLQQQQLQQQQLQQQQLQQNQQMVYPSSPLAYNINTPPTNENSDGNNYNINNNNNIEHQNENEINSPVSQCGRKTINDNNHSASNVLYYYCNNRITNYKNPTQQQQLVSIPTPTTSSTSTSTTTTSSLSSTTTTTTTEAPTTTTHSTKSARLDYDFYTTEKPIFLPTPIALLENSFTPITSTTSLSNSIVDFDNDNNVFKQQRQKYRSKKYEDIRPQQHRHRQSVTRYDDIKRQQQFTTAAASTTFDDMKLHSFFTIEDAVTRAPEMQVFNDPYQAYRHARRHHHSHQRQTTTTTKKPDTTTTTTRKPKFKSFFDDLDEDDYTIPEVRQYDYSLFSNTPKTVYRDSELHNEFKFPEHIQIIDHTPKPTEEENELFTVDEPYFGKAKIKSHNFGLFKAITSTAYTTPVITTYKPYDNFRDLFLTTHKVPHSSSSYDLKPIALSTTTESILRNPETITEKENTTSNVFANEVRTSTGTPIITTTEKKSNRIILKSPLNLRSQTTFKYPKQNGIRKSYKSLTSTTTRATPSLKKAPKYQRQYKTKKLKQFKHLFTTSSTTTSSTTTTTTTTTEMPTTEAIPTKRISVRLFPTTSTTEEPTTKRALITRPISTTVATKVKKLRQKPSLTTAETTSRKKIKSRTSAGPTLGAAATVNTTSIRRQSPRRGSKRANIPKSEVKKETLQTTTRKTENKSRRRNTSTTVKPFITRTSSNLSSASTTSSTPVSTSSLRTSSTTTTTMKSIMRIANSKSRTKLLHNDVKSPTTKSAKKAKDDRQDFDERISSKSITSTISSIPPLPIEIYFKKSHSAKI